MIEFPVMLGYTKIRFIPWEMAERVYEGYARRFGTQQSLETLASRGGFHVEELDTFLPQWRTELSEINALKTQLAEAQATIAQQANELKEREEYWAQKFMRLVGQNEQLTEERDYLKQLLDDLKGDYLRERARTDKAEAELAEARAAHQVSKIDPLGDLSRAAIRQQLEEEEKRLASRPQEPEQ